MDITFYSIQKRQNSTFTPTENGTTYSCIIKDSCSIMSPVIKLDIGLNSNPIMYNYAYIPTWNRYYFISDWTFNTRLWEASLSIDVLATYKTQIGNFNGYVLRSASAYNGNIVDTTYPQKVGITGYQNAIKYGTGKFPYYKIYTLTGASSVSPIEYRNTLDGVNMLGNSFFYVTVLGNAPTSVASYSTYCMTYSGYAKFINALMNTDYSSYSKGSLTNDVYKYIADPLQWIVQVKWCPFEIPSNNEWEDQLIKIGGMTSTNYSVYCKYIGGVTGMRVVTTINGIPNHPDYATRGAWVNKEPYMYTLLDFQPFGTITLDREKIANASSNGGITIFWDIDIFTGDAIAEIHSGETYEWDVRANSGMLLGTMTGNFMVDIPVSQTKQSTLGLLGEALSLGGETMSSNASSVASTVSSVASTVDSTASALSPLYNVIKGNINLIKSITGTSSANSTTTGSGENIATEIGNGIAKIGSVLSGAGVSVSSKGARGSFIGFRDPFINCWWTSMVDEDNANSGRPLCEYRKLNTLSGYILCRNGDISLTATQEEKSAVASYLKTGFFME